MVKALRRIVLPKEAYAGAEDIKDPLISALAISVI